MKFLVLGCNGMAGHVVSLFLKEQGHSVLGFSRKKSDLVDSVVGDAKDVGLLTSIIKQGEFDAVVNCIGVLNQFAESDKASAVFLNSYLPHFLAEITKNMTTKVIQVSTDCVFSGKRGHYLEHDFKDGESFYDRTKALGELDNDKDLTLRQSIVGPDLNPNGIGLFNWFMQQKGAIKGYRNSIWTGLTTLQLAKVVEKVSNHSITGIYNAVPDSGISKCRLLQLIDDVLLGNSIQIIPVNNALIDKSLIDSNKYFDIPDYDVQINELKDWILTHMDLYGNYHVEAN